MVEEPSQILANFTTVADDTESLGRMREKTSLLQYSSQERTKESSDLTFYLKKEYQKGLIGKPPALRGQRNNVPRPLPTTTAPFRTI